MNSTGKITSIMIIAILFLGGFTHAAVYAQNVPSFVPGRYIVVLDDAYSPEDVAKNYRISPSHTYSNALKGFSAVIPSHVVELLQKDPGVKFVERDQLVFAFAQTTPTGIKRILADQSIASIGSGGSVGVDIAIIDTGIASNPDLNLYRNVDCTGGGPFNTKCVSGGSDGNGHGTHVAGTAAALDNDLGVVGVAPGANLWSVKVLGNDGSGYMSWIIAGIDYVTANAAEIEVANMSLGCECTSSALDNAISKSVGNGVVYVVAAGNSAKDAKTFSPANHPDVITVGALADFDGMPGGNSSPTCRSDVDDTLADFTNYGDLVDILAPGVCIMSTWYDGSFKTISGTSMAAPHVAGTVALYLSVNDKPQSTIDVHKVRGDIVDMGFEKGGPNGYTNHPSDPDTSASQGIVNPSAISGPEIHDIAVTNVDVDGVITAGDQVPITVTVQNKGTFTEDFTLSVMVDDALISQVDVSGLEAGSTITHSTVWNTGGYSIGSHTITATVSMVGDENPSNDSMFVAVEIIEEKHDVMVTAISVPSTITVGDTVHVDVTVENVGTFDETFVVTLTSNLDSTIGTENVSLLAGESKSVMFTWNDASLGEHTLTIDAPLLDDATPDNNSMTVVVTVVESSGNTVSADQISYTTEGGRLGDKHLNVHVRLVDGAGITVSGASVSIDLFRDGSIVGSAAGSTGSDGIVTFSLKNAASGCYTTTVTNVVANGLEWDGITPTNEKCK